ncbi:MAG: hypothetical protein KDE58_05315, partial [Caldilineaceae bacterium]|nr:hypothetical protein [Caldilineaceae bacterium]
ATDSAINGGGPADAFRIKIWDKANGNGVVYDNQMGASDDATAGTALSGGSIVIHSGNVNATAMGTVSEEAGNRTQQIYLPVVSR